MKRTQPVGLSAPHGGAKVSVVAPCSPRLSSPRPIALGVDAFDREPLRLFTPPRGTRVVGPQVVRGYPVHAVRAALDAIPSRPIVPGCPVYPLDVEVDAPASPPPSPSPMFRDRVGDKTTSEAIEGVLELRRRAAAGQRIAREDLDRFGLTAAGGRARLLIDREYFEEGLMPAIDRAKTSIHLAALMFDDNIIGKDLADRLIHKKRQNPSMDIKIIADGKPYPFARFRGLPSHLARLSAEGIEVQIHPTYSTRSLEHRKMAIIDGRTALVSGTNCSTEYYASDRYRALYEEALEKGGEAVERFLAEKHGPDYERYFERVKADPTVLESEPYPPVGEVAPHMVEPWAHDSGYELEGPFVHHLEASFIQSWLHRTGAFMPELSDAELVDRYFPPTQKTTIDALAAKKGMVPLEATKVTHVVPFGTSEIQTAMFDFIHGAREKLDLEMSYILVPAFVDALEAAAKRGVKIRIITNGKEATDFKGTWFGFARFRAQLLAYPNVEIYETKTYTHVKAMVADDRYVFVTTGNPERLSWRRTFDEAITVESPALALEVEARIFDRDTRAERSDPIDLDAAQGLSWRERLIGALWELSSQIILPIDVSPDDRELLDAINEKKNLGESV